MTEFGPKQISKQKRKIAGNHPKKWLPFSFFLFRLEINSVPNLVLFLIEGSNLLQEFKIARSFRYFSYF